MNQEPWRRAGSEAAQEIVALLSQTNEILADMTFVEGHRTTIRTGLPSATWRKLYAGAQPEKHYHPEYWEPQPRDSRCGYCRVKTTRTHGNCRQCGAPL